MYYLSQLLTPRMSFNLHLAVDGECSEHASWCQYPVQFRVELIVIKPVQCCGSSHQVCGVVFYR